MLTAKFKALVHLIVASCDDPQRLGATRLNKICWYADSIWYRISGTGMTGESYVKRRHGPVPRHVLQAIRELKDENKILVREQADSPFNVRLYYSLERPDTSVFSEQELKIVESAVGEICGNHTVASISEASHDCIWRAANEGEEIPLKATLASQAGEITEQVLTWADSVVAEMGA